LRVRVPDGIDEQKARVECRNDFPDAEGGIHLFELPDREGNRAARRRRERVCAPTRRRSVRPKTQAMKIHLRQVQPDGLHLEGEEECPIPELTAEAVVCTGPLRYSLDLGVSE